MKKKMKSSADPVLFILLKKWEKVWDNLNEVNQYFQSYADTILLVHQKIKMEPLIKSFESLKINSQKFYDQLDDSIKDANTVVPMEIKLPWESEKFSKAWKDWKDYLLEQHQIKLYSRAELKQLSMLSEIAERKEDNAYPVLDYAMANLYKMFFKLDDTKNKTKKNSKHVRKDEDF